MIELPLKILCMEAKPRDWMVESTCGIRIEEAFRLTTQYRDVFEQGFEWDEAFGASRPFSNPK
jgi:hypothetical protein